MMGWDWLTFWGVVIVVMSVAVCWPYLVNIAQLLQAIEDDHVTKAIERYNSSVKEDS